ncbi:MAG TPA: hypothetical protein VGN39_11455, partial [Terriglobales bacterium]|nr:hypothetical protein [Terriglobales bacterium]
MSKQYNRREILKTMSAASAAFLLPTQLHATEPSQIIKSGDFEIQISPVSSHTVRLSIVPAKQGQTAAIPMNGSLIKASWGPPVRKLHAEITAQIVTAGDLKIKVSSDPLAFAITDLKDEPIQTLKWDQETGAVSFATGDSPLLGLGEGGPQFDRRGSSDRMRSGQGGYELRTHGGRVPIPWLIGTAGWAIYFHQPFGTFDLTGTEGKFLPGQDNALPLDIFVVGAREPQIL